MSNTIRIDDVTIKKATPRAVLVDIDGDEYWIPQSQIHDDSEVWREGDNGLLVISEWFAEKEGIG